ncbi:DMT family transporter [Alphaproteobacteria bacterium]|nr:DMT family transporter [Alphaproteobacteria bacterium]MDC3270462.1 DMT family transporter [Alphaproteobacteria bacterium]
MKRNKFLTVALLAIGATLFGSFMGAGVKLLSDDLHPIIICFYRCLMGLIIITPFVARNNFKALQTDNMRLQIFRALINIISMICWFSAIGMMHFEKATALGFTTPLFTTILAVLILGEVIRFHRTAALLLGFVGILIIIRPGYMPFEFGTILMLIASFSFSFVLIFVKKLSATDSSLTIIFYHLLYMTPAFFILSFFYWESINLSQLIVFILMGASGLLSHWCLAQAFKMSDTTFVMPLQFTKLIWASLIGLFIFSEQPDIWTWIGGVIIFISVVYITYREAFKKKGTLKPIQVDRATIN